MLALYVLLICYICVTHLLLHASFIYGYSSATASFICVTHLLRQVGFICVTHLLVQALYVLLICYVRLALYVLLICSVKLALYVYQTHLYAHMHTLLAVHMFAR